MPELRFYLLSIYTIKMKFDLKNINKFKSPKILLGIFVAFIIILASFQAGVFVGYHKAAFSYSMGDRYYKAFDRDDRRGGPNPFSDKDLPGGGGAVGTILKVNLPTLVVSTPDNVEKIIKITDDTIIRQFRNTASTSDLSVGKNIVVIGSPNAQAEIEAKLIRLLPPPPSASSSLQVGTSSKI